MSVSVGKYTGGSAARRSVLATAVVLLWLTGVGTTAPGNAWRPAPEFIRLLTPGGTHPAAYETYTSPLPLEAALAALAAEPALLRPPGAWQPQEMIALDAFGRQGSYNRWALARLYGARRVRVARGPHGDGSRVAEMWTLISPYPDAALSRIETGTLLIVLHLP